MLRIWHVVYLTIIASCIGFMIYTTTRAARDVNVGQFQAALIRHTNNYDTLTWLGVPIWQPPLDLWILQETIAEVKPELIIECGTFKGGSSLYFAQLFDLMGTNGRVITVDIEKLHKLSHPRVTYLIGDSVSPAIVEQIRERARGVAGPIMVILDSDHSKAHVAEELELYAGFVTPGSYVHVQDGVIDAQPMFTESRPGPLRAIEDFLGKHSDFEVDQARSDRFLITNHPKGWLRKRAT